MRTFEKIRILPILVILLSLIWPYATTVEAQSSTLSLLPASMSTQSGSTGGQSANPLKVKDQSGKADDPQKYVVFTTPHSAYKGTQIFNVPEQISGASVSSVELRVNYKGPGRSTQKWSWSIYNAKNSSWDQLGSNSTSKSTSWTLLKFQVSHPSTYFDSSNQIRIMLSSNNDDGDAKIDYEALNVTFQAPDSASPAATTPTPASVPTSTVEGTSSASSDPLVSATQTLAASPMDTAGVPSTATIDPGTNTPVPAISPTPLIPSATTGPGLAPSDTPLPTNTILPTPTNTMAPAPTNTSTPLPVATATSLPTNTATLLPTNTPTPAFTASPTQNLRSASYYVATNGSDSNAGTQVRPFLTIQKCLNVVQPGTACLIRSGTYNEALSLKTSGTAAGPITIQNYNGELVTVNSGSSKTVQTTSSHQSYYVFDGLRFISSRSGGEGTMTLDFYAGWGISYTGTDEGNGNITLKNCYVEGEVTFYGRNNVVQNCEFNGNGKLSEGIRFWAQASQNNLAQNNIIHDYIIRGVWMEGNANNSTIRNNTVYNVQDGIDCDGAGIPVSGCRVDNNTIYNVGVSKWGNGVFLEDCFDCEVLGNIIHNVSNGVGVYVINYGVGCGGCDADWSTFDGKEYRDQDTNTKITHNVIYNYQTNPGILDISADKLLVDHNSFYNTTNQPYLWFRVSTDKNGVSYAPMNETITNNIYYNRGELFDATSKNLVIANNFSGNYYINAPTDFHLASNSVACGAGAYPSC